MKIYTIFIPCYLLGKIKYFNFRKSSRESITFLCCVALLHSASIKLNIYVVCQYIIIFYAEFKIFYIMLQNTEHPLRVERKKMWSKIGSKSIRKGKILCYMIVTFISLPMLCKVVESVWQKMSLKNKAKKPITYCTFYFLNHWRLSSELGTGFTVQVRENHYDFMQSQLIKNVHCFVHKQRQHTEERKK